MELAEQLVATDLDIAELAIQLLVMELKTDKSQRDLLTAGHQRASKVIG
jgi:hypothetical protein